MVSFALHVVVACVAVVALGAALYMQGFLLDTIAPSPALVVPLAVCLTVAVCASAALVVMQLRAFGGAVARVTVLFCVALWGFSFLLLHWFRYVAAGGGSSAAFHAVRVRVRACVRLAHSMAASGAGCLLYRLGPYVGVHHGCGAIFVALLALISHQKPPPS